MPKKELTFGIGNMKMKELALWLKICFNHIVTFDLPAGWTCPKANLCLSKVSRTTGKRADFGEFVCYATKAESIYPNVRESRWRNFDALRSCKSSDEMADMLERNIRKTVEIVRIHSSGDFFNKMYFDAWVMVAERNPHITFFAYTKVLEYAMTKVSDNFGIVYSYGSKDDEKRDALEKHVATCYVATYEGQYPDLPVLCGAKNTAHEDYNAILNNESFVLSFH